MMYLYLVQHGEAIAKDVDPSRPLTEKGRDDISRLAEWLDRQGIKVAEILHSGKTRARQTAELLDRLLERGGRISETDGLGPNDSPKIFLRGLRDAERDILVAGHMPFVARTLSVAVTAEPDRQVAAFEPGSVAGLVRHDAQAWHLVLFARPGTF